MAATPRTPEAVASRWRRSCTSGQRQQGGTRGQLSPRGWSRRAATGRRRWVQRRGAVLCLAVHVGRCSAMQCHVLARAPCWAIASVPRCTSSHRFHRSTGQGFMGVVARSYDPAPPAPCLSSSSGPGRTTQPLAPIRRMGLDGDHPSPAIVCVHACTTAAA